MTFFAKTCALKSIAASLLLTTSVPSMADVTRFIASRVDSSYFDGRVFGQVGTYSLIEGTAHVEIDPADRKNRQIVDLGQVKRNASGKVEIEVPVHILTPSDPGKANGKILYDVVNRGRKMGLYLLNDASLNPNPSSAKDAGNGFLMDQGYTVVFSGWQSDVKTDAGLLGFEAPVLRGLRGKSTEEFVLDKSDSPAKVRLTYPAVMAQTSKTGITVKQNAADSPSTPPDLSVSFISPTEIQINRAKGFDDGAIYTVTYQAQDPTVSGLGFVAIRDVVSYLKYTANTNPTTELKLLPHIDQAYAIGFSQSGRFIRDFIYLGMNEYTGKRKVFDGVIPYAAGSRKTFINSRFAQPGRFSLQHEDHDFPGDQFPFSYADSKDHISGKTDGILRTCSVTDTCPKVMQVDSDSENLQARTSLLVTTTNGQPLDTPSNVRLYFFTGVPHAGLAGAKPEPLNLCQNPSNPLHGGVILRALLTDLDDWASKGVIPPGSRYPNLKDGTLVSSQTLSYQGIPDVGYTGKYNTLDYKGADKNAKHATYPVLLAQVDQDGFAVSGIRQPKVAVPLATYLGWNVRKAPYASGELCKLYGSTIPFSKTKQDRESNGDSRLSLEERYASEQAYLEQLKRSVNQLISDRLLLKQDADEIVAEGKLSL